MKKKVISVIVLLFIFILFLSFPYLKSLFVMYFYSQYQEQNSIMAKNNFSIKIPGGTITKEKDWYPFVMTFHDKNISSFINENIGLTILYNFGAFEDGRSLFYKEGSDYFSAFYGAYVIESKDKNKTYGFHKKGKIIKKEIMKIPSHDLENLVLKGIGCSNAEIAFRPIDSPRKIDYLSYEDWTIIDSIIISRSPLHKLKGNHLTYLQYGKPPKNYQGEDFSPIELYGRIYCRYFKEYDVTILLYILAPDFDVVEKTDRKILSKTRIKDKD